MFLLLKLKQIQQYLSIINYGKVLKAHNSVDKPFAVSTQQTHPNGSEIIAFVAFAFGEFPTPSWSKMHESNSFAIISNRPGARLYPAPAASSAGFGPRCSWGCGTCQAWHWDWQCPQCWRTAARPAPRCSGTPSPVSASPRCGKEKQQCSAVRLRSIVFIFLSNCLIAQIEVNAIGMIVMAFPLHHLFLHLKYSFSKNYTTDCSPGLLLWKQCLTGNHKSKNKPQTLNSLSLQQQNIPTLESLWRHCQATSKLQNEDNSFVCRGNKCWLKAKQMKMANSCA